AGTTGYVTGVDTGRLVALATRAEAVIEIVPLVGDHIIDAEPIARMHTAAPEAAASLEDAVRKAVTIGNARSPHQDIRFALQQVVEIAVRALSPGTNDPYTAQNAIEELGSGMAAVVAGREPPEGIADDSGTLRLVLRRPRPMELIDLVFDDLRAHITGDPRTVRPAIQLAERVAAAGTADLAQRAWLHIELLLAAHSRSGAAEFDVERMRALAARSATAREAYPMRCYQRDSDRNHPRHRPPPTVG